MSGSNTVWAKLRSIKDADARIRKQREDLSSLSKEIERGKKEAESLAAQIDLLKGEVIELEEKKLLQDFSLYEPSYSFATSREYKDRLQDVRIKQKQMIKEKTAATCSTEWTVDGSRAAGRKMTSDNIKQMLMTFNTECENAISNVRFDNFESMRARIEKLYNKLNMLGETSHISLTQEYCDLKIQELTLAYEYERKKQEEKEYEREQRAIAKENAKVQKELEQERRRIEKEQSHYKVRLSQLNQQYEVEKNEGRRELIKEKMQAVQDELVDLDKALKDVDYRQANERAGYVYVISNIGAFGEGIYKIGMTRRLDPQERIDELGSASVPFKFDVHAMIFSDDAPRLETALHNAFADKRVNMVNNRKEFYRVSLEDIEDVVKQNYDRTAEFSYIPTAQQYRESLKVREVLENAHKMP